MKLLILPLMIMIGAFEYSPVKEKDNLISKLINTKLMLHDTIQQPAVSLEQVVLQPMTVLFISDSSDMAGLSKVISSGYGELFAFINQNGLKPGKVMAFYLSYANPVSLQTAVEVDKVPSTFTGRIQSKTVEGGNAVVAHYTGPYEEMELAYKAITKWVKDNNKQSKGMPFEVYLNSPDMVKDKHELKTDVYQLLQ